MSKTILECILEDFEKIRDTEIVLNRELPVILELAIHKNNFWSKMELSRIMLQPGMVITPYLLAPVGSDIVGMRVYVHVKGIKFGQEDTRADVVRSAWPKLRCAAQILQAHGYFMTEHEL